VYRLNGLPVMLIMVGWYHFLSYRIHYKDPTEAARNYTEHAFAAFVLGLILSFVFFVRGRDWFSGGEKPIDYYVYRAPTIDMIRKAKSVVLEPVVPLETSDTPRRRSARIASSASVDTPDATDKSADANDKYSPKLDFSKDTQFNPVYDFYAGHEFNPRITPDPALPHLFIDVKMYLYMWGAALLMLNVLSIVAAYAQSVGGVGAWATVKTVEMQGQWRALAVWALMLSFFLIEYMYHEHVHLLTYDIFAEKIGFKLVWGCIFFYPFFYAIGGLPFIHANFEPGYTPYNMSIPVASMIIGLFFFGWTFTRGANMQKYQYKMHPEETEFRFLNLRLQQKTIESAGGKGRLLCSGFWSKARHINYFGEIVQAIAIALPGFLFASHHHMSFLWQILPWLYPLYYIALFVPREREDARILATKYGSEAWNEYTTKVPYRIIPFVY
jgi:hypothetical protein